MQGNYPTNHGCNINNNIHIEPRFDSNGISNGGEVCEKKEKRKKWSIFSNNSARVWAFWPRIALISTQAVMRMVYVCWPWPFHANKLPQQWYRPTLGTWSCCFLVLTGWTEVGKHWPNHMMLAATTRSWVANLCTHKQPFTPFNNPISDHQLISTTSGPRNTRENMSLGRWQIYVGQIDFSLFCTLLCFACPFRHPFYNLST